MCFRWWLYVLCYGLYHKYGPITKPTSFLIGLVFCYPWYKLHSCLVSTQQLLCLGNAMSGFVWCLRWRPFAFLLAFWRMYQCKTAEILSLGKYFKQCPNLCTTPILWQWGAGNIYLLVLSSWKVYIADNPFDLMELYIDTFGQNLFSKKNPKNYLFEPDVIFWAGAKAQLSSPFHQYLACNSMYVFNNTLNKGVPYDCRPQGFCTPVSVSV